jgi:tol-pal system protein YbgF
MKIPATLAIACAVAALPPASAAAQNREHQQMAAEVRMLQEQMQQLTQALSQTRTLLNEIGESVKQLNESSKKVDARLEAQEGVSRKALADQKVTLDSLSTDLRIVREGTQNVNTRIGILSEEVEALRTALPAAAAPAAATGDAGAPPSAADAGAALPVPAATAKSGLTPNRLFQAAMADYGSGAFSLAISGFQQLLNDWPKSEQADDAQFYIGSSYMQQKKYPEAVKAYSDLIATYPTGDKVPDAYVDLGQAYRAQSQNDAARTAWETVRAKFPSSNSAIIARERLDGLPPPAAPPKP